MKEHRNRWIIFRSVRTRAARPLALGVLILMTSIAGWGSRRSGSAFLVVAGTAADVTPKSVTVMGPDLKPVTIATQEDFTQKVAAGSKVTAWYYAQGDGYALRWLSYSLENDFMAPARILSQVKSVALLPDSKIDGADGLTDIIAGFMKDNLGWRVTPKMWAAYIQRQMLKKTSTLDAFDTKSGKFDMKRYLQGQGNLISALARRARVNAVLEIQIETVDAPVSHKVAVWDGVQDPLTGKTMRTISKIDLVSGAEGKVPAATVVLKLWSPQQQLLWSNRRGFAALERYQGLQNKLISSPLADSLEASRTIDRWLKMVFASFVKVAPPPKNLD